MLKTHSLIDPMDLSVEEIQELFVLADDIKARPNLYINSCEGKLMGTLFYEPSTRTRLSFASAMNRLGGRVVGFSDPSSSSASKGESIADTARMLSAYADIIVMRHPTEGAPKVASMYSDIPVINAGDGGHNHPTQTLTDLYTIYTVFKRVDNLKIGLCGDLRFGRTVHSLIIAMSRYANVEFYLISPEELTIPHYLMEFIKENNIKYTEVKTIEEVIGELDILYMTRIQRERFYDDSDYERLKDVYVLDDKKMLLAKKDMIVMHPLPRVKEIAKEVDYDPRSRYFKQARYGMFIRMALILKLLEVGFDETHTRLLPTKYYCKNTRCITKFENEPEQMILQKDNIYKCMYCDYTVKIEE